MHVGNKILRMISKVPFQDFTTICVQVWSVNYFTGFLLFKHNKLWLITHLSKERSHIWTMNNKQKPCYEKTFSHAKPKVLSLKHTHFLFVFKRCGRYRTWIGVFPCFKGMSSTRPFRKWRYDTLRFYAVMHTFYPFCMINNKVTS